MKNLFRGKKKFLTISVITLIGLFFLPITILVLMGWLIYSKVSNKKIKILSLAVVGVLVLLFCSAYVSAFTNPTPSIKNTENIITPTSKPLERITNSPTPSFEEVKVIRVIDGDTVEIEGGQKIRYIGIDTPEVGDCYSVESTNKNKQLVEGKIIRLEKDVSETDRYGRLLRYVYIEDVFVNEILVKDGYAQVYTYPPDVKYNEKFLKAQKEARKNNSGLWSVCPSTSKPTSTLINTISTPIPTTPVQESSTAISCMYSCSSPDRDCSDFSTHAEAQSFFNCCGFTATHDPMKLDSVKVGDGVACESLP
ncbi:MAG TPA: thermonuclease family protein [Patescibacteria group bacterium]|nr:thermonuclease family protein [Patescibacteria group bacterium]